MPKLDLSQLSQAQGQSGVRQTFEAFDANHDGVIDLDEFEQGMATLAQQPAATPVTSQRQTAQSLPRASTPRSARNNAKANEGASQSRKAAEPNAAAGGQDEGGDEYVLFNLDIDLGKNSSAGRIAVRAGDDPKRLAAEFAAKHRLPENAAVRLQKLISENMRLHKR